MPGKGRKVFSRPITEYLDAEGEIDGEGKEQWESIIDTDSSATLQAIRSIIAQ